MRRLALAFVILPLGSCTALHDSAEVRVCERKVIDRLKSPTSYQRASVAITDRPATREEVVALGGPGSLPKELQRPESDSKPGIRTVRITFDALNPMGVALRDRATCLFPTEDGAVSEMESLLRLQADPVFG